jgi:hypothetical protein
VTFNFFFTPKLSTAWLDPQYLESSEIIEKKIYRFYADFFPLDFSFKRQDTVGQAMQLIILE